MLDVGRGGAITTLKGRIMRDANAL